MDLETLEARGVGLRAFWIRLILAASSLIELSLIPTSVSAQEAAPAVAPTASRRNGFADRKDENAQLLIYLPGGARLDSTINQFAPVLN